MRLPPMYEERDWQVAKLMRPIYGLKQGSKNWNKKLR